jgi:pilus assembly protein CpaE
MNEHVIAYAFSPFNEGHDGRYRERGSFGGLGVGGSGHDGFGEFGAGGGGHDSITMFTSSELCRATLRRQAPAVSVIVCNEERVAGAVAASAAAGATRDAARGLAREVSPINLAAALCMDTPERDVYLLENRPTESLAGRARAAGIRGILDVAQAHRLLTASNGLPPLPRVTAAPAAASALSTVASSVMPAAAPATLSAMASAAPPAALTPATPTPLPSETAVTSPLANPSQRQGQVIGFFSGRGGVGKSTVALMAALIAQMRGLRVALVDLDLQFGDMGYLAGKEPSSRIQHLSLEQLCSRGTVPALSDDELTLVLAPEQPERGEQLAPAIPHLLNALAAQRDLVVINTGSFWMDVHAQSTQRCDHLIFLMDQRATSIEACKQVVELCVRLRIPQARFHYLLNGCGRHAVLEPRDASLALGGVMVHGLADGGTLVDELLALGCPLELLGSGNTFVASLETFLGELLQHRLGATDAGEARGKERRGSKILSFPALRGVFGEAHRVAP